MKPQYFSLAYFTNPQYLSTFSESFLWSVLILRVIIVVLGIYVFKTKHKEIFKNLLLKASLISIGIFIGSLLLFILLNHSLGDLADGDDLFDIIYGSPLGVTALIIAPFVFFGSIPVILYSRICKKENKKCSYEEACLTLPTAITSFSLFLLLFFALEGIICIIIALPLIGIASFVGANVAYFIISRKNLNIQSSHLIAPLALLPLLLQPLDGLYWTNQTKTSISSSIIIKASPEQIWPQVKAYSELKNPLAIKRPIDTGQTHLNFLNKGNKKRIIPASSQSFIF